MLPITTPAPPDHQQGPYHIVMITPYFWPTLASSTILMKELAEGLAEAGNRVTVLTNASAHATQSLTSDPPLLKGHILRAWNPFLRRLGVLTKLGEYLWYVAYFLLRGLAVGKIDIIFVGSTPPLAGLPAALLARLKGAKLVYNLQDLFPDSAVVAGMLSSDGRAYRWLRKAEAASYRVADLVCTISPAFSDHAQRLVPGTTVATIPNWVDTDQIRPTDEADDPAITEFRRGGTFVVQYAGTIGFMQSIETVVHAAECLKHDPDIKFVFIGDGNAKQSLQALAREKNLDNCEFLPMQPLERVPSVYNACDLGMIPLKPGAAMIALPSKTWNYLSAACPVVGCVESDSPLANVIRASGAGSVIPPDDPARLAQVILEYRNAPERGRSEGLQGRAYVEAHLSRRSAIQSYIRMFDQVLAKKQP